MNKDAIIGVSFCAAFISGCVYVMVTTGIVLGILLLLLFLVCAGISVSLVEIKNIITTTQGLILQAIIELRARKTSVKKDDDSELIN